MAEAIRITKIKIVPLETYLGSAVKITVILNVNTPTTMTITIENPSGTDEVTSASMTADALNVYSYIYQSDSADEEGNYLLTITAVKGDYTSVEQDTFSLLEQD